MRIVIDGRFWSESGIGRYIRNLVKNLQEIDTKNEYFILLLKKEYDGIFFDSPNFQKVLADFKWYGLEEQVRLPKLLRDFKPDLVHFPHFNVPILYKGRYIVTIHDLIHQHFHTREVTTKNPVTFCLKKYGYRKAFSFAVNNSLRIISPSEFVKKQLINEWKINEEKVVITPEGVDEEILKLAKSVGEKEFTKTATKFKINPPFLFYVGNAQPHKNILNLIKAFALLKKNHPKLSLVLSGPENSFWKKIKEGLEELEGLGGLGKDEVIFTGFISEEELVALYKNAQAFVLPSLEEGFGIPLLEAMACGTPVVCSRLASLPEIGGDAASYFDPKDEKDMGSKIHQVISDEKLRKDLTKKGLIRYKNFSWRRLALQTLDLYNQKV